MHPVIIATAVALLVAGPLAAETATTSANAPAAVASPNLDTAKSLVKEFAGTLKGELEAAMKAGGPVKAIGVCQERAPAIAADIAAKSGWEVGRVSLKARNAKLDTPDVWEKQVLTRFDERKAAGEPVDPMAFAEVVATDGKQQFRFMKAIPTGEVCLACHGTEITPEVTAALDQAYPGDPARGYALGDVRGAFSVASPIQ